MKPFDLRKYITENKIQTGMHKSKVINEGAAKSFLGVETRRVEKGGGNSENLIGYGLPDVANTLDTYSSGAEIIYTSKTITLFKKFVESMANDEIKNNQPNP